MKPNSSSQVVRGAASTTGLLFVLLLVVFTASNYSWLNTDRLLLDVPPNAASHATTASSSSHEVNAACDVARGEWVPDPAAP